MAEMGQNPVRNVRAQQPTMPVIGFMSARWPEELTMDEQKSLQHALAKAKD
jgi:hypothetical protein